MVELKHSAQIVKTTIDLQQEAGSYDLLTAMSSDVLIESLTLYCPTDCGDDVGAFTGIRIKIEEAAGSPEFVSVAEGVKGNLWLDSQLRWTGAVLLKVGKKVKLVIYGGPTDEPTVCDVVVRCRVVGDGGYLS